MIRALLNTFLLSICLSLQAVDIREDGLVATLYKPESQTPIPVIVTISGSNGGLPELRAEALAEEGFASLALGYFGAEGLPDKLQSIPLEYFEKAFQWIKDHPDLDETRVGLYGISRGGELVLILGSWFPEKVHAIVATAPSNVIIGTRDGIDAWTYQGKSLAPPAHVDTGLSGGESKENPAKTIEFFKKTPFCEESAIPVEKATAPILLITGGDDKVWPAKVFAEKIIERQPNCVHYHYPLAGHGINAPNSDAKEPLYFHPKANKWFHCGGSIEENLKASEDSWKKLVTFFKETLMTDKPKELYKITTIENWESSQSKKHLILDSIDDQFIHFSKKEQVAGVIEKYWPKKPYILLTINPAKLEGKLVLEYNSDKSDKYYHIYDGNIPLDSVVEVNEHDN